MQFLWDTAELDIHSPNTLRKYRTQDHILKIGLWGNKAELIHSLVFYTPNQSTLSRAKFILWEKTQKRTKIATTSRRAYALYRPVIVKRR